MTKKNNEETGSEGHNPKKVELEIHTEKSAKAARIIRFGRSFNVLFSSVFFLTLFSALAAMWLSYGNPTTEHQTELQNDLFRVFCAGWQSGLGAILGLIGGKMTK